ncbi:MAG: radical SAM protein [Alphaproteobacteria bacterium]|nr:radical SAM protein [Alphaproteobacteria bacterium]
MAKVLLLNPNKWGRGITVIWVASHAAALRAHGHEVRLFDATFYADWAENEVSYNTANQQYQPTDYDLCITFKQAPIREDLQRVIDEFDPDIVFWSALSSHIHGEGEYVSIQFGHDLMTEIQCRAVRIAGGLQVTANPAQTLQRFPGLTYAMGGETELLIRDFADRIDRGEAVHDLKGLVLRNESGKITFNPHQDLIHDLDELPPYDYSLFEDQVFFRPYNGEVVRAVDYELSRGCIYTCSYCVETVIQHYYDFDEATSRGTLIGAQNYLRHKSADRVMEEITTLHRDYGVTLFRCQDTNFLTIDRTMLNRLADLFDQADLPVQLYIETRPEGVNAASVQLLKRLRVDGVGMGIELATQGFRENNLNRFSDQDKIVRAFELLKDAKIRRTTYNVIGFPEQDEQSILDTIMFNNKLQPDNVTVAFYSPFIGTGQHLKATEDAYFADYDYDIDPQLRTLSLHNGVNRELLQFYKNAFARLAREGLGELERLKREKGLAGG